MEDQASEGTCGPISQLLSSKRKEGKGEDEKRLKKGDISDSYWQIGPDLGYNACSLQMGTQHLQHIFF